MGLILVSFKIFYYRYLLKISARFDLPCLLTYITSYCGRNHIKMEVIKKCTSYMAITLSNRGTVLSFRDVLNFTPPCSMDRFLRSWEAPFTKSIFPYQKYKSIEEIHQSLDFPTRADFFNSLKQV